MLNSCVVADPITLPFCKSSASALEFKTDLALASMGLKVCARVSAAVVCFNDFKRKLCCVHDVGALCVEAMALLMFLLSFLFFFALFLLSFLLLLLATIAALTSWRCHLEVAR